MGQITVNKNHHFEIEQKDAMLLFEGDEIGWDIQMLDNNTFHVLYRDRSYDVEVILLGKNEVTVKINGNTYIVERKDEYDALLKSLGMVTELKNGVANLKAPMPGLVLDVMVKIGDTVRKGESLLVLEAMKMENIIKSPNDVVIKSIEIEKGTKVEKNQLLILFE